MSAEVKVTVNGETIWVAVYRNPKRAAENWQYGFTPKAMQRRVARALRRAGKA